MSVLLSRAFPHRLRKGTEFFLFQHVNDLVSIPEAVAGGKDGWRITDSNR